MSTLERICKEGVELEIQDKERCRANNMFGVTFFKSQGPNKLIRTHANLCRAAEVMHRYLLGLRARYIRRYGGDKEALEATPNGEFKIIELAIAKAEAIMKGEQ